MNGTYKERGMDFHLIEDNNLPSTMPTAVDPPSNSNNIPYCTGDSSSRAVKKRSREWRSSSTFDSDEEWKQWLFTRGEEYDRDVSTENATCPPVIESSPQRIQAMRNDHHPKTYSNRSLKGRPPTPWENLPIGYNPYLNLHHESKNILTPPEKLSNSSRFTRLIKQKLSLFSSKRESERTVTTYSSTDNSFTPEILIETDDGSSDIDTIDHGLEMKNVFDESPISTPTTSIESISPDGSLDNCDHSNTFSFESRQVRNDLRGRGRSVSWKPDLHEDVIASSQLEMAWTILRKYGVHNDKMRDNTIGSNGRTSKEPQQTFHNAKHLKSILKNGQLTVKIDLTETDESDETSMSVQSIVDALNKESLRIRRSTRVRRKRSAAQNIEQTNCIPKEA